MRTAWLSAADMPAEMLVSQVLMVPNGNPIEPVWDV